MNLAPWGEWRPDVADINGNHTRAINNVIPRADGYGPIKDLTAYTDALPAVCRGAFRALNSDGSITLFAGTASQLYRLDNENLSWVNVSKTDTNEMSYAGSSNIGDLTGGGNLAAAFDGTTSQAQTSCATKATATSGYVGKTLASPRAVRSVKLYGSNDAGYVSAANPNVTLDVYAKQGTAPASRTDGTVIGTATFADTANESVARTITSTDLGTEWDHVWVSISHNGSAATIGIAEIEIFSSHNYSLPSDGIWQWGQYDDFVFAVQGGDAPQSYELGVSSVFANLAGSPPIARYIGIINEFVVLTGLVSFPYRSQWSGRSAPTTWTSGVTESDFQDFVDGGPTGPMGGGEASAIQVQTYAMRRMTYQPGNPVIFAFDRISDDIGILAPYSMIRSGQRIFFLSNSGFQMSVDGGVPEPIGKERVDSTFTAEWDDNNLQLTFGFADPRGTRVFFAYKTLGTDDALFNKLICYDWKLDRWTPITAFTGEFVGSLAQIGQTLEGLDAISTDLDALDVSSLDAFPVAFGKEIAIFNTTHELGFLRGDNVEAVLETPELGEADKQFFCSGGYPVSDADIIYGQVSYRPHLGAAREWTTENERDSAGLIPARIDTKFARLRNRIPAGAVWTYSSGVLPKVAQTGNR